MKSRWKMVWIVLCMIAVILSAGLLQIDREGELTAEKIVYVSSQGESTDTWIWQLTERNIADGTETILYESDEQIFLLESVHGRMACAVMDSQKLLTIYDFQSGGVMWKGDASGVSDPERYVVTFDGDYLYVAYGGGGDSANVIRMDKNGREEELGWFEDENAVWFDCFTISPDGKIACSMRSRVAGKDSYVYSVYIWADDRGWVAAEGSAPRWISENELLFVQDSTVMMYQCDMGESKSAQTESGNTLKVFVSQPTGVLDPYCLPGYLVYNIDTSYSDSMPNPPDVGVTSLKDGRTFRLKRVNTAQFGNGNVFVILDEVNS